MSINILASYLLLGLSLAAPIGPVNSAVIDKGIKNGFWHAWVVGIGSVAADGIFMLLVYLGLSQFLNVPMIQIFLWLFGAFVLLYTGVESILKLDKVSLSYSRKKDSLLSCFSVGFLMSITSPLSILFWIGIYGSVLAQTAQTQGTGSLLLYSAMIFLGLTTWDLFMATLTSGFRKFLNTKILKAISVLSGLSLLGFGLYFGQKGIVMLLSLN
ncbi:LysE family transporter [Bacillus sp. AGMB 02131]|uniref:LysE family transporter n=1 Tax=Peribacillus faecalis TaxID=2772559 RepID=A0A927CXT7_9BACI|nr:LysE family transporter [Peribacillus faecalis]MBD3107905.1 LysE family transporter [Peribacillus faecalis]